METNTQNGHQLGERKNEQMECHPQKSKRKNERKPGMKHHFQPDHSACRNGYKPRHGIPP
jgi:hypothetical protein